ncbi:hypothetical protein ACIQZB_38860 [Streptomyces sp. NPDC097727]|uniref:hypothetical protein n=1 Tax=Streptomyces sp. NPDC097727 TaxID=3366092 RepID=UPI0037F23B53
MDELATHHLLRDDLFACSSPLLCLSGGIAEGRDQGAHGTHETARPGELAERVGAYEHHRSPPGDFRHFVRMRFIPIRL